MCAAERTAESILPVGLIWYLNLSTEKLNKYLSPHTNGKNILLQAECESEIDSEIIKFVRIKNSIRPPPPLGIKGSLLYHVYRVYL